jgi:hypothetical protein
VLYLNTDGTYVLNNMPFDETKNDSVLLSKDNSCLLQCYSNGYVNKTSITEILRLRKGFTYSHGLFTGSNLQYCNVSTNDDFIIALFEFSEELLIFDTYSASLVVLELQHYRMNIFKRKNQKLY